MQLNQNAIQRLLSMNDEQLTRMIGQLAADSGIDLSSVGIDPKNLQALRRALGSATDEDIKRYAPIYDEFLRSKQKRP